MTFRIQEIGAEEKLSVPRPHPPQRIPSHGFAIEDTVTLHEHEPDAQAADSRSAEEAAEDQARAAPESTEVQ